LYFFTDFKPQQQYNDCCLSNDWTSFTDLGLVPDLCSGPHTVITTVITIVLTTAITAVIFYPRSDQDGGKFEGMAI